MSLILTAIMAIETPHGELVGDGGRSLGRLQITAACVRDVNRIYHRSFRHRDALYESRAREIATLYLRHYRRQPYSVGQVAQIWNAGPDAVRLGQAVDYGRRVEQEYWRLAGEQMKGVKP